VIAVTPWHHAQSRRLATDFIETLADGELERRLKVATDGPEPQMSRFLQVLGDYPRARRNWLAYRQHRVEQWAIEWLQARGLDLGRLGVGQPARSLERSTGLSFDAELDRRLAELRNRLLEFAASPRAAAARQACRATARFDEIYHSNAVRGNRLTRAQTEDLLITGACVADLQLREHLEAVNLDKALARAETFASCDAPLTEAAIRELHALLFAAVDDEQAGSYRREDTRIIGRDYLPPESVLVPSLLREFIEWLDEADADPLALAAAAQAKILHMAPFSDGNGRVGRLVSNLILHRAGYPPAIVRVDDRRRYYDGMRAADGGDMTDLLKLLVDRVELEFERWVAAERANL
jgi:cell filamentation protein, protein adenylyltransferase